MFDCVLPTRLARHGTALTSAGRLAAKAARVATDGSPLDPTCRCAVCARHSRAYIRHLFNVGEPSAGRLVSLHNLAWLCAAGAEARRPCWKGAMPQLAREVAEVWRPLVPRASRRSR